MHGAGYRSLRAEDDEAKDSLDSDEAIILASRESYASPISTRRRFLRWAGCAMIITFCLVVVVGFVTHRIVFDRADSSKWMNCGSTVAEAHQRNCFYDVMIGSWLLPECSDPELMEEYLAARDWEFYRDSDLTEPIPMDILRLGEHDYAVYATVHQHQHHCAYVWEKQFRSAALGNKMDDLSADIKHTHHCAQAMYTGMPGAKGNLGLMVKYFSCVKAGEGDTRRSNNPNNTIVPHKHKSGE